jgi:hypothetical protein
MANGLPPLPLPLNDSSVSSSSTSVGVSAGVASSNGDAKKGSPEAIDLDALKGKPNGSSASSNKNTHNSSPKLGPSSPSGIDDITCADCGACQGLQHSPEIFV